MKNTVVESFLWSQSSSPVDGNWFVIDGLVSNYCQNEEQKAAMSFMTSPDLKRKTKHKQDDATSTGFEIKESKNAIQLSGNFLEVDEAGRPLVYVFTTRNKEINKAIIQLKDYSNLIGLSLRKEDLESYQHYFESRNKRHKIVFVIGFIAVLTILFCILLYVNNNVPNH